MCFSFAAPGRHSDRRMLSSHNTEGGCRCAKEARWRALAYVGQVAPQIDCYNRPRLP
jgi:hypothetical protein